MKVFISQPPERKTTDGLREEEARIAFVSFAICGMGCFKEKASRTA